MNGMKNAADDALNQLQIRLHPDANTCDVVIHNSFGNDLFLVTGLTAEQAVKVKELCAMLYRRGQGDELDRIRCLIGSPWSPS